MLHTLAETLVAAQVYVDPPAFHVEVSGQPVCLDSLVCHEVFSIGSEAIRNAFRHARARKVEVRFRYSQEEFALAVIDDGTGIDPDILAKGPGEGHFGLAGMQERARIAHGELIALSEKDLGTRIELTMWRRGEAPQVRLNSGFSETDSSWPN
jgi:signal transduction histidine kinase